MNKAYATLDSGGEFENIQMTYTLFKNLPSQIYGTTRKEDINEAWLRKKPTVVSLQYDKWITFNSEERVSLMVFDLDKKEKSIKATHEHIKDVVNIQPNWIIETNKGYQFGWQLANHVFLDNFPSKRYLRAIKKEITKRFGCDKNASHRNTGFMRNPLAATNYIFDAGFSVELGDFHHLLPVLEKDAPERKRINMLVTNSSKNYTPGNRHRFMCIRVLEIAQKLKVDSEAALIKELIKFHDKLDTKVNKLENEVIEEISKWGYNIYKNQEIDRHIGQISKFINPPEKLSIFQEYGRHLNPAEFAEAVRKRRVESAHRTNAIRPKNHLKQQLKKRQKRAVSKIKRVIKNLEKENKKITQTSIVRHSKILYDRGVSPDSVKKFLFSK